MRSVLVVNAGSSSLKVRWWPHPHALTVERIGPEARVRGSFLEGASEGGATAALDGHGAALDHALALLAEVGDLGEIAVVGHRVVHGGERFTRPTLLDDESLAVIERLTPLAPLHNPANLAGVAAARARFPTLPHVAVFDTAFHSVLPARAYLYGLPMELYRELGVRRYGFHGTSHDYVSARAAELLGRPREALRLVTLHLGNGASAAAVAYGRSVDTSMGFTPLEGLVMGTRSGSVDPGALLHLLRSGYDAARLDDLLQRRSGLLGLSGVSNDVRDVRAAANSGNADAQLALEVFAYRVRTTVGAYAAAMGGIDGVVFTGGIGENDAAMRAACLEGLAFLGLEIDPSRNARHDAIVGREGGAAAVLVVPTDEESTIARAALEAVDAAREEDR